MPDIGRIQKMPAYKHALAKGIDTCAAFAIAKLLRRLHGGEAFQVISGSATTLDDGENGLHQLISRPSSDCRRPVNRTLQAVRKRGQDGGRRGRSVLEAAPGLL